jgi:succinyl-diaminopimelate desuccinylase
MDERILAEKLIAYDSSTPEGIRLCAGFVKGWLEARDIPTKQLGVRDLPILIAEVGPESAPTVVLHGHIDVVPGREGQFESVLDGDRLIGRGAYDMKGAVAAMMLGLYDLQDQREVRVRLAIVPDEEAEDEKYRGSDVLVDGG